MELSSEIILLINPLYRPPESGPQERPAAVRIIEPEAPLCQEDQNFRQRLPAKEWRFLFQHVSARQVPSPAPGPAVIQDGEVQPGDTQTTAKEQRQALHGAAGTAQHATTEPILRSSQP